MYYYAFTYVVLKNINVYDQKIISNIVSNQTKMESLLNDLDLSSSDESDSDYQMNLIVINLLKVKTVFLIVHG